MKHGTYVGPCPMLAGKTALIRKSCEGAAFVRVQFDDTELVHRGKPMGFNWHRFHTTDFTIDPPVNFDDD